mmetsp:Transcript_44638/g.88220  ORF Transcript_44638/g.88220 Transcript_44638/m.88220 type:complete len:146 (-) Transcript_44638:1187-1624(-)
MFFPLAFSVCTKPLLLVSSLKSNNSFQFLSFLPRTFLLPSRLGPPLARICMVSLLTTGQTDPETASSSAFPSTERKFSPSPLPFLRAGRSKSSLKESEETEGKDKTQTDRARLNTHSPPQLAVIRPKEQMEWNRMEWKDGCKEAR